MQKTRFGGLVPVAAGVVAASLLAVLASQGASGQDSGLVIDRDPSGARYVSGEVIVTYEEPDIPVRPESANVSGGLIEENLPAVGAQVVSFPEVTEESDAGARTELLAELSRDIEAEPEVASVDFNYLRETVAAPDDPLYGRQGYLGDVKAPAAWDLTSATSDEVNGPRLAVIDTGIDLDHPDLAGKIVASTNTANPARDANDTDGHGTHVAGIAAARTDNAIGVAGTCPECALLVAKVSDDQGYITTDSVIAGINWAVVQNADVMNISLAGRGAVEAERIAVSRAVEAGVTVVAAAGNESTNVRYYPAAYEGVISVSATTSSDTRARYSNYGDWIDLSAPGLAYSTVPGSYGEKTGTSMASPIVAGVAGLLSGEGFDRSEIEKAMTSSASDLGVPGRDPDFGHGEVDAEGSLNFAANPTMDPSEQENTDPTVSNQRPKGLTQGRTLTVAATVKDAETDLASSNITLIVDGDRKGFAYDPQTDRLTKKMSFAPGKHRAKVVAVDGEGGRVVRSWVFTAPRR